MALIDLDASLTADSAVTASAVMAYALGSSSVAGSVFTPPLMSMTKVFGSSAVADSVMAPAMLLRGRPMAAPIVADSSSSDAVGVNYAILASPVANSLGSGFIGVAKALGASAVGGSVFPPSFMLSTDGLFVYVVANSVVGANMTKVRPLAALVVAGSSFSLNTLDIFRLPRPNVPQARTKPPALRQVPNPPGDPKTGIATPVRRGRGL